MSYVGKAKADWTSIRSGYQDTVDFIHEHNPRNKFFLNGVYIKSIAAEYLLTRARKRPVRQDILEKFEDALRKRVLMYMGGFSTIHIDKNGEMVDIQGMYELLHAIINTNSSVEMNICLGIDCGLINHLSVIRMDNKYPATPVAEKVVPREPEYEMKYPHKAIRLVMAYQAGSMKKQLGKGSGKVTEKDAIGWCKRYDTVLLGQCMGAIGMSGNSRKYLTKTEWNALRYITAKEDSDDSITFFEALNCSRSLSKDNPITALRNKFTSMMSYNYSGPIERMAFVLLAWNAYRNSEKVNDLLWDADKEEFPKAI